jgi:hypothetical protein
VFEKALLSISALSILDISLFMSNPFLFYVILFYFFLLVSFPVFSQVSDSVPSRASRVLQFTLIGLILGCVTGNRRDQSAVLNVRMDMHISL